MLPAANGVTSSLAQPIVPIEPKDTIIIKGHSFQKYVWKNFCKEIEGQALKSVQIIACEVDDTDIPALMNALKKSSASTLKELVLDNNYITEDGIPRIADFIREAQTLERLSLAGNYLNNTSVLALTQALRERQTPLDLNLSNSRDNMTTPIVSLFLEKVPCLRKLNLEDNATLDGIRTIPAACKHLNLQHLSLKRTNITEEAVSALAPKGEKMHASKKQRLMIAFPHEGLTLNASSNLSSYLEHTAILLIDLAKPFQKPPAPRLPSISQFCLDPILRMPTSTAEEIELREMCFASLLQSRFEFLPTQDRKNCFYSCLGTIAGISADEWRKAILNYMELEENEEFLSALLYSLHGEAALSAKAYCLHLQAHPEIPASAIEVEMYGQSLKRFKLNHSFVIFNLKNPPSIINDVFVLPSTQQFGNLTQEPFYFYEQQEGHFTPLRKRINE